MFRGIGLKRTNLSRLSRDRSILKEGKEVFFTAEADRGQMKETMFFFLKRLQVLGVSCSAIANGPLMREYVTSDILKADNG